MPSKRLAVQHIGARLGPARSASLGVRVCVAAIAIVAASISSAGAQDWPTRPIRLVVGAAAGGGTDISARLIAQPLAEILGQAVVVENRAGAAGTTAAEAVAKSAKDGYTAYMMSNAHAISAAMYKSLRYDPINDFQMVSMVATAGLVLVAAPAFPASDLAGVLAAVRANPGKFNFGSAGVGTTQHFAGELMKQTAGLDITHVPYRSTPAAVTGLRAGEVEFVFDADRSRSDSNGRTQGHRRHLAEAQPHARRRPDHRSGHGRLRRHELVRARLSGRHGARGRAEDEQSDAGTARARERSQTDPQSRCAGAQLDSR
jgi:hypothetical protein